MSTPPHPPDDSLQSLYLYLTDRCNLRCFHCWISPSFSGRKQAGIHFDALRTVFPEAKALGLQTVKLTGGEPLLYNDLDRLLALLADENLNVQIETNGTLIDGETVARFKDARVSHIAVSLDSATEATHDTIRGVPGSFRQTIRGIRHLSRGGLDFQIIMTLQRQNHLEIEAMIELSRSLGAGSVKINHMIPCGRACSRTGRPADLEPEELIALYRQVQEKGGGRQINVIFDLPFAFRSIEDLKKQGLNACHVLNIMGILANGDYSICGVGQTMAELRMGNLYRDSIREVWQAAPVLEQLRQTVGGELGGICGKCIFKFQCRGGCRAGAYSVSRDFKAPYFLCQRLYEKGLFPLSRTIS
jgi:SynChlorMet cassette radical SAM/SPASM protein ScmF